MKWWAIVRMRSRFEAPIPEWATQSKKLEILRGMVANDVQPIPGIEAGNMWFNERVGREWEKGHWKWSLDK